MKSVLGSITVIDPHLPSREVDIPEFDIAYRVARVSRVDTVQRKRNDVDQFPGSYEFGFRALRGVVSVRDHAHRTSEVGRVDQLHFNDRVDRQRFHREDGGTVFVSTNALRVF